MKLTIKWFEYPTRKGPYQSGGWSRNARRRPSPVEITKVTDESNVVLKGKSVFVEGVRKLKCNIYAENGIVIRNDYPSILL